MPAQHRADGYILSVPSRAAGAPRGFPLWKSGAIKPVRNASVAACGRRRAGRTMILPCRRSPSVQSVAGNEQGRVRTTPGVKVPWSCASSHPLCPLFFMERGNFL